MTKRKCTGCGKACKGHSGPAGQNCPAAPSKKTQDSSEDAGTAMDGTDPNNTILQKLLNKVEQLELAMSAAEGGKKSTKSKKVTPVPSYSEDEDADVEKMTPAQLRTYVKNLNKEKNDLKKNKPDSFLSAKQNDKPRSSSISSIFADNPTDDSSQSELRKAAEALKSRNKDEDSASSTRIKDASVINDLRKDPRLRSTVDQFMQDIGERAKWFERPGSLDSGAHRRDPRSDDRRHEMLGADRRQWDDRADDYDQDRASRDSILLNKYRGNYRGQKEMDEYLVRNTLSTNTVAYAGVALQKTKELNNSNCNIAQYGVGAFFFLKNALIDKTINSKSELFNILSHYEHVFTCTANGTFSTNELSNRAFRVALQYDHKVSSSIDAGVTSWARLGESLHAEYMLNAKDIIEAKERKNNMDRPGAHGMPGKHNKFGNNGNDKIVTICGDFNVKENQPGKCTWAVTNNKNCRFQHSCRFCWNEKKQLFNHRELECKVKSGEPFLDNGQN